MKLYLLMLAIFFSCRNIHKSQYITPCRKGSFYEKVEAVSIYDTSRIRELDGKLVEVEGFFYYNFEDMALYPSRSSNSTGGALWIETRGLADGVEAKMNKKKVVLTGRINRSSKGHLGGYLATLDSTFCIREVIE